MIIYAVDDIKSFEHITSWISDIKSKSIHDPSLVLIANKSDLSSEHVITTEMGQQLADKFKIPFFETSAKESEALSSQGAKESLNVNSAFSYLIRHALNKTLANQHNNHEAHNTNIVEIKPPIQEPACYFIC